MAARDAAPSAAELAAPPSLSRPNRLILLLWVRRLSMAQLINGSRKEIKFPLTLTLSPIGGEGIKLEPLSCSR